MREVALLSFVTLDGVMQSLTSRGDDPSDGFRAGGWGAPYWSVVMPHVYEEAMREPYDLLLGRRTYEAFAAHWRSAAENDPVGRRLNGGHKYVATRSTGVDLSWGPASMIGDVGAEVAALKSGDGPLIQVHGSADLIQSLVALDLVDEYRLWTFPVVVGGGKRLFERGGLGDLRLLRSEALENGVVMGVYRPV